MLNLVEKIGLNNEFVEVFLRNEVACEQDFLLLTREDLVEM